MSRIQEFIALENLADIMMGQSPDSDSCNTDESGLPFLQGCAEFGRQSPSTNIYCFPPLRISKPDSVLMSVRAPVGKMNWGERNYCIGRGLAAIKAKPNLADTKFLNYSLKQNISFLHRRSQGSTFLAIGANDIKIFPIPAISYEKQRKISSILETIDRTISHTEALIEKYQQIKAGLMHDLFTRGIGADGKLRPPRDKAPELYQESAIGWIPKEWKVENILDVVDFPSGQVSPLQYPYIDWILVAPDHVERNTGRLLSRVTARDQGAISGKYLFDEGDIVYSKIRPYLRKAILASFYGLCSADMYPLKVKNRNNPTFVLGIILGESFSKYAESVSMRSGFPKINRSEFSGFECGIPKPDEQNLIAIIISSIDSKITSNEKNLEKLRKQKSGLMHDLLTGTVRVNSDPV